MTKYCFVALAVLMSISGCAINARTPLPIQKSLYGGDGVYDYDNFRDVHGFPLAGWAQLFL
jgi:hypothetical protein